MEYPVTGNPLLVCLVNSFKNAADRVNNGVSGL